MPSNSLPDADLNLPEMKTKSPSCPAGEVHMYVQGMQEKSDLSCDMTKPTNWLCAQRRLISLGIRPVWSESSLSAWRNIGSLGSKALIRLGGCPGWSESSLGIVILLVLSCRSSFMVLTVELVTTPELLSRVLWTFNVHVAREIKYQKSPHHNKSALHLN